MMAFVRVLFATAFLYFLFYLYVTKGASQHVAHLLKLMPVMILVLCSAGYYLFKRLISPFQGFVDRYLYYTGILAVFITIGMVLMAFVVSRLLPFTRIAYFLMLHLGFFYFLLLLTLLSHGVEKILQFVGYISQKSKLSYNSALSRLALTWFSALVLAAFSNRLSNEGPFVSRVNIHIPNLDLSDLNRISGEKKGYNIVQISDLHIAPIVNADYLNSLVEQIKVISPKPDCIVITGDLLDGYIDDIATQLYPLAELKSLAKDGVYFVTGNHDYYYTDFMQYKPILESVGIKWLHNSHADLKYFNLLGVDDVTAYRFNPNKDVDGHGANLLRALSGITGNKPNVLLAHSPNQLYESCDLGIDLQLSGHTHAGQMWPLTFLNGIANVYVYGLHTHKIENNKKCQIYVSSGTFWWGPPMRLFTKSEIVHITLLDS